MGKYSPDKSVEHSLAVMLSQDEQKYIRSRVPACTSLTDTKWSALDIKKANIKEDSGNSKKPGIDFPCPPALVNMLSHHWRDMQDGFCDTEELNKILVFQSDELRWTAQKCGLWSLEYKQELTSPLCIAAAQGFTECLLYLLQHGAQPNLIAGGKTALHEACANCNTECALLLLEHGADPNQLTEDGLTPLHLCRSQQSFRCAKALVRHGAKVDHPSEEEEETPLHISARHGLLQHAQFFLRYGANVNMTNSLGKTPLGVACSEAQEKITEGQDDGHLQICRLLLTYGANVNLADSERRSPLHMAARNVQISLVRLLLDYGADINAIDYNGCTPLSNVLQNAVLRQDWMPHAVVQTLLNHGSIKVWPLALLKVLTTCAAAPKTVEILFNSYTLVPVTSRWAEAIPDEIFQLHKPFYESLFALEYKPRCLQHLCRSAIRKHLAKNCYLVVQQLPVPKVLEEYLLLEPEGYIS